MPHHQSATSDWRRWLPHIRDAGHEDVGELEQLCNELLIPSGKLNDLLKITTQRTRREEIARHGGFLEDSGPDTNFASFVPPNGISKVLCLNGRIEGFFSVMTNLTCVQNMLASMYGWSLEKSYDTAEDLPDQSDAGTLEWVSEVNACWLFNHVEHLALAGDLGLASNSPARLGGARALMVAMFSDLPDEHWILARIFEIREIDRVPLRTPVSNKASRVAATSFGFERLGILNSTVHRRDDVELSVGWDLLFVTLKQAKARSKHLLDRP